MHTAGKGGHASPASGTAALGVEAAGKQSRSAQSACKHSTTLHSLQHSKAATGCQALLLPAHLEEGHVLHEPLSLHHALHLMRRQADWVGLLSCIAASLRRRISAETWAVMLTDLNLEGEDVLGGRLALQHFPRLLLQLVHCCLPSPAGCLQAMNRKTSPLSTVPTSSPPAFRSSGARLQGACP